MSLMFVITGVIGTFIGLGAYAIRAIRDLESIVPDYEVASAGHA